MLIFLRPEFSYDSYDKIYETLLRIYRISQNIFQMVTCPLFDPKAYQRNSETFFLDNITPHQILINYLATALLKPDFCLLKKPKKNHIIL